jgi:hypothetical protein
LIREQGPLDPARLLFIDATAVSANLCASRAELREPSDSWARCHLEVEDDYIGVRLEVR